MIVLEAVRLYGRIHTGTVFGRRRVNQGIAPKTAADLCIVTPEKDAAMVVCVLPEIDEITVQDTPAPTDPGRTQPSADDRRDAVAVSEGAILDQDIIGLSCRALPKNRRLMVP